MRYAWLLALVLLTPAATSQPDVDDGVLFVRPHQIERTVYDGWSEGTWIGSTRAGLFFKPDAGGPIHHWGVRDGLLAQYVWDIAPTPDQVWISTALGPVVLEKSTGRIHQATFPDGSVVSGITRSIAAHGDHAWVATDKHGLVRIDRETYQAEALDNPHTDAPFEKELLGVAAEPGRVYFTIANTGLVVWDLDSDETRLLNHHALAPEPLYSRVVLSQDSAWVGTSHDGVIRYFKDDWSFAQYANYYNLNGLSAVNMLAVDNDMWVVVPDGRGLSHYDHSTDWWQQYDATHGHPWPAGAGVWDVAMVDGTIHATTKIFSKVHRFNAQDDKFEERTDDWFPPNKMPSHNNIQECEPLGDDIMVSTGGGGALIYDRDAGTWTRMPKFPDGLWDIAVKDTAIDGDTVYFATFMGLSIWDRATDEWALFRSDGTQVQDGGNSVVEVEVNAEWAAAATKSRPPKEGQPPHLGNLAIQDRASQEWTTYTDEDGLTDRNLTAIALDGDKVWVGSPDGLDRFDIETESVTQVWDGFVNELHFDGVTLWMGADEGLYEVDRGSLEVESVPGFETVRVNDLSRSGDTTWLATSAHGLVRWPDGGEPQSYRTGQGLQAHGNCVLPMHDLIYFGTQWGLERFDPESEQWLLQGFQTRASGEDDQAAVRLAITTPGVGSTHMVPDAITVQGTVEGIDSGTVQVRIGASTWVEAEGLGEWQSTFETDGLPSGETQVLARLLSNGQVIAQAARAITIDYPGTTPEVATEHSPVLRGFLGSDMQLSVATDPVPPGLSGELSIQMPGESTAKTLSMVATGDGLEVTSPTLTSLGTGTYSIRVSWDGGRAIFPPPFGGFGDAYRFDVIKQEQFSGVNIVVPADELEIDDGQGQDVSVIVQNTGTQDERYRIQYSGSAVQWLQDAPDEMEVPASQSQELVLRLEPGTSVPPGQYDLKVRVVPSSQANSFAEKSITFSKEGAGDGGNAVPGLGTASLLVLVALALLGRRR